jgi:tetratricopeptide (TPR) repeat protein
MPTILQRAPDIAVAVMILTGLLSGQDSRESRPASRPAAESRQASLRDVVDAGRDLLDRLKGEGAWRAADRIVQEGFAAQREGRHDDAVRCFERVGKEFPKTHTTISWMLMVSVHVDRNDLDAAVAVVENALEAAVENDDRSFAYSYLGTLHERRGDWRKALDATEKWHPLESDIAEICGTETVANRQFRIARCRFHLGEIDAALKLLESLLSDGISDVPDEDPIAAARQSLTSEVGATYAEYSGRSGRIAGAKSFAATLRPRRRTLVLDSLKVVEAWLSKDPAAVLKVVSEAKLDDEQLSAAGRLMVELGRPAIEHLVRKIEAADVTAIRVAGVSGHRELLAPLEKRHEAAGTDIDDVIKAIQSLECIESRPASRPAK